VASEGASHVGAVSVCCPTAVHAHGAGSTRRGEGHGAYGVRVPGGGCARICLSHELWYHWHERPDGNSTYGVKGQGAGRWQKGVGGVRASEQERCMRQRKGGVRASEQERCMRQRKGGVRAPAQAGGAARQARCMRLHEQVGRQAPCSTILHQASARPVAGGGPYEGAHMSKLNRSIEHHSIVHHGIVHHGVS